jgi:CRP-like cAMP-binding protein
MSTSTQKKTSCQGPSAVISDISLFKGLSDEQLARMLSTSHCHNYSSGERIFNHGDKATHFYWLCSGQVKLTRISPEGDEKCIEVINAGKTFAEAVMFMENGRYPVNAETISNSKIISFSNHEFREILKQSVDTCFSLLADLSRHLHMHLNEIERLTLSNAMTRLIVYLLDTVNENGEANLGISKHLLASRLSIKPETLSRLFSKLQKEGLISVDGQTIKILNNAAIRRQAHLLDECKS